MSAASYFGGARWVCEVSGRVSAWVRSGGLMVVVECTVGRSYGGGGGGAFRFPLGGEGCEVGVRSWFGVVWWRVGGCWQVLGLLVGRGVCGLFSRGLMLVWGVGIWCGIGLGLGVVDSLGGLEGGSFVGGLAERFGGVSVGWGVLGYSGGEGAVGLVVCWGGGGRGRDIGVVGMGDWGMYDMGWSFGGGQRVGFTVECCGCLGFVGEVVGQEGRVLGGLLPGTDNAKITRKRSKPDKHEHEKGKSAKEPKVSSKRYLVSGEVKVDSVDVVIKIVSAMQEGTTLMHFTAMATFDITVQRNLLNRKP
ncbi:hypothetical protein Tco_1265591 [Tanacetum coccineum]